MARRRRTPSYKLPDSALTPTQLRNRKMIQRRRRQDRDPLLDPMAPLAGRNLARAVDQIVAGQFDPAERAYRQDIADTTTQGTALMGRAGDYYQELAKQEQRGIQTQTALGNILNQRLDAVGQQAAQSFDAAKSAEQQRLGQDAAVRGEGLQDPAAGLAEIAALRANAGRLQASAGTEAALGTNNWANLANAMVGVRGLRGAEVQQQLGNRMLNQNRRTQDALTDLAVKRGGARSDTLLRLRQQGFENLATQRTLGLKAEDLQLEGQKVKTAAELARDRLRQQAAIAAAGRRVQRAGQRTTAETARLNREAANMRARWTIDAKTGGGPAGLTPAQATKRSDDLQRDVNRALSIWRSYQVGPNGPRPSPRISHLVRKEGVPEDLINFARDLNSRRTGRRLSWTNYRRAIRMGLNVPPEWRPRRRRG